MRDWLGLGGLSFEPGHKLFGRPWVKVRLGLIGAAVLGTGALVAPRAAQPVLSVPDDRVVPLLEERVVAREDALTFRGVQRTARDAARFSVAVPGPPASPLPLASDFTAPALAAAGPLGYGVIVSRDGDVITHDSALDGSPTVQLLTSRGLEEARVTAYEKASGLTLLRLTGGGVMDAPAVADPAEPGALVAAVGRVDGQVFVQPAFVSSVSGDGYALVFVEGTVRPGAPIFDTDGKLVAITTSLDNAHRRAVGAAEAIGRLTRRAAEGRGHETSIGVVFQSADGLLVEALGARGALVADVVEDGPADQAGLVPGDVLTDVNGQPVDSPAAALAVLGGLAIGSPMPFRVWRRGTTEELLVTPASAFELAARARRAEPLETSGLLRTGDLWPPERLRSAGVPLDARVLEINNRAVTTPAQARREIARRSPAVVHLWHEGQRFHAAVERAP
jgi:S1-C subfamily serine protease